MKRTREMDSRELGTVLAALRHWQATSKTAPEQVKDISTDGGQFDALCSEDIDQLCEQLNYGKKPYIRIPFKPRQNWLATPKREE